MYVYRPRNISRLENAQGAPRYFHTFLHFIDVVSRSRNRSVEAVSKLYPPSPEQILIRIWRQILAGKKKKIDSLIEGDLYTVEWSWIASFRRDRIKSNINRI